jgi:hypothetical protein
MQNCGKTASKFDNKLRILEWSLSLRFVGIAAAGGHSCALEESGKAHCWGFNDAWLQLANQLQWFQCHNYSFLPALCVTVCDHGMGQRKPATHQEYNQTDAA